MIEIKEEDREQIGSHFTGRERCSVSNRDTFVTIDSVLQEVSRQAREIGIFCVPDVQSVSAEFSRQIPDEYAELIEKCRFIPRKTMFANALNNFLPKPPLGSTRETNPNYQAGVAQQISPLLRGKIFIDLGCGDPRPALDFSKHFECAGYVGVDRSFRNIIDGLPAVEAGRYWINVIDGTYPYLLVKDDMLRCLVSMRTEGRRIFHMSGIESEGSSNWQADINKRYFYAVLTETSRLADSDDVLMIGTPWFIYFSFWEKLLDLGIERFLYEAKDYLFYKKA